MEIEIIKDFLKESRIEAEVKVSDCFYNNLCCYCCCCCCYLDDSSSN